MKCLRAHVEIWLVQKGGKIERKMCRITSSVHTDTTNIRCTGLRDAAVDDNSSQTLDKQVASILAGWYAVTLTIRLQTYINFNPVNSQVINEKTYNHKLKWSSKVGKRLGGRQATAPTVPARHRRCAHFAVKKAGRKKEAKKGAHKHKQRFIRADECNKTTFTWMNFLLYLAFYTFILFQFTFLCVLHRLFNTESTLCDFAFCAVFLRSFFFIYLLCLIRLWERHVLHILKRHGIRKFIETKSVVARKILHKQQ